MKLFSFLLLFVFLFTQVSAQNYATLITEADRLEAIPNEKAAFLKFKEVLKLQPTNLYALTKCSELSCRVGGREKSTKVRDEYYASAQTYAKTALRLHPNSDEANVAMAFSIAKTLMLKSGKEKITAVKELKSYGDKAVTMNPKNFKAWHVLGRWNYELGNLNFIERTAAKLLYGSIPEGSLKKAIVAFEKSNSISNGFILNYFELAKAYNKNDEKDKAIYTINKMLLIPNHTEDDPAIKEDARRLLQDIK